MSHRRFNNEIRINEATSVQASVSDNGYDGDGEESVGFGGGADSDAEGLGEEEAPVIACVLDLVSS